MKRGKRWDPTAPLDFGGFRAHEGCPRRGLPGGQALIVRTALTTNVVTVLNGRDTGKSVGLDILFWEEARETEGMYEYIYVAQGHPQAERTFEKHVKLCEAAGAGFLVDRKNKGQDRWCETRAFGRNAGTRRHFWSGEKEALMNVRGPRGNRLAGDEAPFIHRSIITACVPMLGTRRGKMIFVGTAQRGGMGSVWFGDMFRRGVAGEAGYAAFNMSMESNPYLSDEHIAFTRNLFRDPNHPDVKTSEEMEECDGAIISDLGACFRNLDASFSLPFKKMESGYYVGAGVAPKPAGRYVIGQDWGRKDDHSISSVFDRATREQVALRVEPTNRSYDEYVTRLSALKTYWGDALVISDDRGAGEYANSRLTSKFGDRYRGVALTGRGENSKGGYVARMKDLFDLGTWKFLAVPEQKEEFSIYQQTPIGENSNGFNYGSPPGKHDDMVSAAMFASTVLQIDPPRARRKKEEIVPLSPAWFHEKAKERRAAVARSGLRW